MNLQTGKLLPGGITSVCNSLFATLARELRFGNNLFLQLEFHFTEIYYIYLSFEEVLYSISETFFQ